MKIERIHSKLPYAMFEIDQETNIDEVEIAQSALEKLRPRYLRHPEQRGITGRLSNAISREQALQRPATLPNTPKMVPLVPSYATVLGNALQLYVADTLTDMHATDTTPVLQATRVLETIAAKSMLEVLSQEFPIRPFAGVQSPVEPR